MMSTIRIFLRGAAFVGVWMLCGSASVQAQPAAGEAQAIPSPGQVPPLPPDGIPAFPGAWDGGDETSLLNVINNYYEPGPATNQDMRSTIARIEQRNMYSPGRQWEAGNWYPKTQGRPGKWYVAGNLVEGFPDVTADNWKGMQGPEETARVNTPFEGWPVRQETAMEAFHSVLAGAGATLPRRDAVDARVIEVVRTGKVTAGNGIVNDPKEVGGYPDYSFSPGSVPVDTDHDGMPDEWERKYELNPAEALDSSMDADQDGYTNVEEYLNGTNPQEKIDYRNLGNNVDAIS